MTTETKRGSAGLETWLRVVMWGGVLTILALPAIAMRAGAEGVNWTTSDFVFAGGLLGGAALIFEITLRTAKLWRTRLIVGAVLGIVVLTIWAEGAVGIFH